jgi:hypothetical protein
MATFCTKCGHPVTGHFCTACGAAIQESAAQAPSVGSPAPAPQIVAAPAPAPAPAGGTSSAVKIVLILVGVLFLCGAAGIGGMVYVGYRAKQKMAQLKKDYAFQDEGSSSGSSSSTRTFAPSQGSGCSMLQGQEAAQVLGVAVERAESETIGTDGSLMCRYWVTAAERQRFIKEEFASSVAQMGKDNPDTKSGQADIEKLIGGVGGLLAEINGDNKNQNTDYAFSLQVWRKNGKEQWDKMETAQSRTKDALGSDFAGVAMQSVDGIADRAIVLPAGHSIMVLKGDTFFLLGFQQFVPGRDKTAALARIVAGHI